MMRKFLAYYDDESASARLLEPLYKSPPGKPLPFQKVLYFLYGTLMDPNTLSKVLGTQERPEIKPAHIFGYQCKLWGPFPALIDEVSWEPVHGVVYEVKNVEEQQKLVEYNGAHYSLIHCRMHIEGGSRVWGCTFKWKGDESCLTEGAFDIDAWRKQQ
jgi:gamma-glutamylcyclotransferase (GGCT)/AIG2-like uncharacterized protein YtfP